ncbi:floral defensin-like protein 2 [Pyrus ussuriensis x Pyrus communis]|uniref:Floral defensin-like protein 2 n=1 Tax=Pyrus ussuriensis x Pyrus communis TaxID=2448454 RepID=A0A5N5FKR0_9ROSA|nr:floral defensin-like protein 2 [Pyrus ussuriensis x Pyrus communis]
MATFAKEALCAYETMKNTEAVGQEEMKITKAVQIGDCTDHKLIGFCIKTRICNRKCINQGYEGGKCSAFLRVCYRPCPT